MDLNLIWLIVSLFWTFLAVVFTILYWVNFVRIYFLEMKINKFYAERDNKVKEIRKSTGLTTTIEGQSNMVIRNYNEQIEPLERKRRFIIEKLPFLKR